MQNCPFSNRAECNACKIPELKRRQFLRMVCSYSVTSMGYILMFLEMDLSDISLT